MGRWEGKSTNYWCGAAAMALVLGFGPLALADTTYDLTTDGSSGAQLPNARFYQWDGQPTGSGVLGSFVRVDNNVGTSSGYNTTVDNVLDNGSTDTFNHELFLSNVPLITLTTDGKMYREFVLDINELGNNGALLSLDEIQIFTSETPNQSTTTFAGGIIQLGTLVWRLDDGMNNRIDLDARVGAPGSGVGDMILLVDNSLFNQSATYVYLYSQFGLVGGNSSEQAGFEEWATRTGNDVNECSPIDPTCVPGGGPGPGPAPIPEPSTILLLGSGLVGLGVLRYRRSHLS